MSHRHLLTLLVLALGLSLLLPPQLLSLGYEILEPFDTITVIPFYEPYPGRNWNEITIIDSGTSTPVSGAQVDIVFQDAAPLLCWCLGQTQPTVTRTADANGYTFFEIYGGGCVPASDTHLIPARIYADGFLIAEVSVNSPDVVDNNGITAADGWDPQGVCQVAGNDANYHTPPLVFNTVDLCSNFDQGKWATEPVNSTDASVLTPFIVNNSSCTSQ